MEVLVVQQGDVIRVLVRRDAAAMSWLTPLVASRHKTEVYAIVPAVDPAAPVPAPVPAGQPFWCSWAQFPGEIRTREEIRESAKTRAPPPPHRDGHPTADPPASSHQIAVFSRFLTDTSIGDRSTDLDRIPDDSGRWYAPLSTLSAAIGRGVGEMVAAQARSMAESRRFHASCVREEGYIFPEPEYTGVESITVCGGEAIGQCVFQSDFDNNVIGSEKLAGARTCFQNALLTAFLARSGEHGKGLSKLDFITALDFALYHSWSSLPEHVPRDAEYLMCRVRDTGSDIALFTVTREGKGMVNVEKRRCSPGSDTSLGMPAARMQSDAVEIVLGRTSVADSPLMRDFADDFESGGNIVSAEFLSRLRKCALELLFTRRIDSEYVEFMADRLKSRWIGGWSCTDERAIAQIREVLGQAPQNRVAVLSDIIRRAFDESTCSREAPRVELSGVAWQVAGTMAGEAGVTDLPGEEEYVVDFKNTARSTAVKTSEYLGVGELINVTDDAVMISPRLICDICAGICLSVYAHIKACIDLAIQRQQEVVFLTAFGSSLPGIINECIDIAVRMLPPHPTILIHVFKEDKFPSFLLPDPPPLPCVTREGKLVEPGGRLTLSQELYIAYLARAASVTVADECCAHRYGSSWSSCSQSESEPESDLDTTPATACAQEAPAVVTNPKELGRYSGDPILDVSGDLSQVSTPCATGPPSAAGSSSESPPTPPGQATSGHPPGTPTGPAPGAEVLIAYRTPAKSLTLSESPS